jgi:hypothetical protein
MSPDVWLLLTDIGMTGFITAVIVSFAIVFGRRESRQANSAENDRPVAAEKFLRRAS